jgi:hypothetical protein
MAGDWRKLHNEELHNLYSSSNTIRMIKSRRMRWGGHVAQLEKKRNAYRILVACNMAQLRSLYGFLELCHHMTPQSNLSDLIVV